MPGAPRRHRHRRSGRSSLGRGAVVVRTGARGAVVVGVAALLGTGLGGSGPAGAGAAAEVPPRAVPVLPFAADRTAAADGARWDARAVAEESGVTATSLAVARAALDAAAGVEALRVSPEPPAALADLDDAVLRLRVVTGTLGMGTTPAPVARAVPTTSDLPAEPEVPVTVLAATVPDRVTAAADVQAASAAVFRLALAVERSVPVAVTENPAGDVAGLVELERVAAAAVAEAAVAPTGADRARPGTDRVVAGPLRADGTVDPALLCPVPFAPGALLRCDAAAALARLNEVFRAEHGTDLPVGGTYRTYEEQVRLKAAKGGLAAHPGTSHHGWGVAVDFSGFGGVGQFDRPLYRWMVEHGPAYGWVHPAAMGPGGVGPHEPWHWEYAGPPGAPAAAGD